MNRRMQAAGVAALLTVAACAPGATRPGSAMDPRAAMEELLAADRAFSAASARTDLVSGLSAMFAADVVMPLPSGAFAESAEAAAAALRENAANTGARAEWTPVRGGISADGEHGFTFGYMTIHQADGTTGTAKYLSYWVKQPAGWRIAVYRRVRRPAGEVPMAMLPPALPARMMPPSADRAGVEAFRASLDAAERAFSDEAQVIGLGPAFARWGSADAMNMGIPSPAFTMSADSIGAAIGADAGPGPSPVVWAPDRVIIASSGDLGVTIGRIRPKEPPANGPDSFPFFTIWRRPSPDAPWRYVAE